MSNDSSPTGPPSRKAGPMRRIINGLARLKPRRTSPVPWAALAGLLSAGAAISASELIGGITDRTPSLVLGVSDAVVDSRFVPGSVVRWSIDTFGSAQKPLLFYGVLAATLVLGVLTGIAARRRRWIGPAIFAVFGTVGALAANANATSTTTMSVLSAALAAVIGVVTLWWMLGPITPAAAPAESAQPHPYLNETGRRWFLTAAGATAVGALVASGVGRYLLGRRGNVEADRADVADLLSSAEVRTDTGGAGAPPTTFAGGTTPTTGAGGTSPAPAGGTTKPTSGPGGDTIEATASGEAPPDEAVAGTTPTTAAAGDTTPTTVAADGTEVAAPTPVDTGDGSVPTTQAPAEAPAPGTTQPSAGGNAPPAGRAGRAAHDNHHASPAAHHPGAATAADHAATTGAEPGGLLRQHGDRHLAHRDAQLGLLPDRHRAGGPLRRREQLGAVGLGHGQQPVHDDLQGTHRHGPRGDARHAELCLQ